MTMVITYHSVVDPSGRVPMPVSLRKEFGVQPGSKVCWIKDESGLRLRTFEDVLKEVQGFFMSLSPPEDVWSERLIKGRKEEAARE